MRISLLYLCQRHILLLILACKIFELVTRYAFWDTVHPCNPEIVPDSLCHLIHSTHKIIVVEASVKQTAVTVLKLQIY